MAKKKKDELEIVPEVKKIEITKRAIEQFKVAIKRELQPKGTGIRLRLVEVNGGFRYDIQFETKDKLTDDVFLEGGIRFYIHRKEYEILNGYTIDFVENEQAGGFLFEKK